MLNKRQPSIPSVNNSLDSIQSCLYSIHSYFLLLTIPPYLRLLQVNSPGDDRQIMSVLFDRRSVLEFDKTHTIYMKLKQKGH